MRKIITRQQKRDSVLQSGYTKDRRRFSINVRAELYEAIKTDSIMQGETLREYVVRGIAARRPVVAQAVVPLADYR